MLRIKDPKRSVPFYVEHFNMRLLDEKHFGPGHGDFSLYFLATIPEGVEMPKPGTTEANDFLMTHNGVVLELTHNHGTEDEDGPVYSNGNEEPHRGYGHIGFLADDVYEASASLEAKGVAFRKRPDEGRMKGLAFALDPDGYWVEIVRRREGAELYGRGFSLQQCMLRVKDPKPSIAFYRDVMGMRLVRELHFGEGRGDFSLYFLASVPEDETTPEPTSEEAGHWMSSYSGTILELTHNHGTEKDEAFSYHNGNSDPRGFGHLGFLVPDVEEHCKWMEEEAGVTEWQKRPHEGRMKGLAFARDPDGYWVEIIKRGARV
jgi:lactoylglutathione lyase